MPPYVRCAVLACALVRPPANAGPLCQYAGTSGSTLGERTVAHPCVSYADTIQCRPLSVGRPDAQVVVVICHPEALGSRSGS